MKLLSRLHAMGLLCKLRNSTRKHKANYGAGIPAKRSEQAEQ